MTRFVMRMGFDNKAMTASVIDMAVKGYLKIEEKDGSYTVRRADAPKSVLSSDEAAIVDELLGHRHRQGLRRRRGRRRPGTA